jgi:hypothetical protein
MMAKSKESEWITQYNVVDPSALGDDAESDSPYAVEYNADGERRIVDLSDEQVEEVRAFNGLPAEEIVSADEE